MDFLFIYIFILLTGKLEICRVLKQLEKASGYREQARMSKGGKSILVVIVHVVIPPDFPVPWLRDQGKRHMVFVTGLLPGMSARGHLPSSKSTLHVVFTAELCYRSCLAPRPLWPLTPEAQGDTVTAKAPSLSPRRGAKSARTGTSYCWLMSTTCCLPLWTSG